jgi:fibronectin-binding autotransporter adhesin
MKPRPISPLKRSLPLVIIVGAATSVHAVDQTKNNNNALPLDNVGAWVGGAVPGATDLAIFDSTFGATPISVGIGTSLSIKGIQATSTMLADFSIIAGGSLTIGSSGIDMSAASRNFTIQAQPITLGANQTWDVNTGKTLTLQNSTLSYGANTLNINSTNGGGTVIMPGTLSGTGAWTIGSGATVRLTNGGAPYPTSDVTISSGGVFNLHGVNATAANVINLNGSGISSGGALISSTGTTAVLNGPDLNLQSASSIGGAGNISILTNSPISGSGKLTKVGAGTVTLGSANTGNGGVTLEAGALKISTASALGTGTFTINGGGTTTLAASPTISGIVVNNTGATAIATDGVADKTITLGAGGITVNSGAGAVSIGVNVTNTKVYFNLSANQSWINNGNGTLSIPGANAGGSLALGANQLTVGGTGNTTHAGYINGSGGIRKTGAGTLTLSGFSSFTGALILESGILDAAALANVNTNSSMGKGSATSQAGDLVFGGGTLRHSSARTDSTNRLFTIGNDNGLTAMIDSSSTTATNTMSFTGTGALAFGGSGARTLTLTGSNTGANSFAPIIGDGTGGTTTVAKSGIGIWTLSGNNSFTGNLQIDIGTLKVATLADSGSSSNAGAGSLIRIGSGTFGGVLDYTGGGSSTNRTVQIGNGNGSGDTGSARIRNNGSTGALVFTAANFNATGLTGSTAPSRMLYLGGTNTGANEVQGVIADGLAGTMKTDLTKEDGSTWILSGASSYTGATTVSGGKLVINGNISTSSHTTVNTGGILGGSGTVGALTVNGGGTLAPGNSIESLGAGDVSFAANSTFAYELNSASLNGDLLDSTGTLDIAAGAILSLTQEAAGTLAIGSKLTLISYFGGWTNGELFTYLGGTLNDGGQFTLGANEWVFDYDALSGGSNFSTDQTGATRFVTMTVVPEPGAALLGGLGLLALLRRRR